MSGACRVCLKDSIHIFSLKELTDEVTHYNKNNQQISYCEMFNYCTKLAAKIDDYLPQGICFVCASNLIISYKTITKAIDSENKFLIHLNQKNIFDNNKSVPLKLEEIPSIEPKWGSIESLNESLDVIEKLKSEDFDEDVHQDYEFLDETELSTIVDVDALPLHKDIYTQNLLLIEPIDYKEDPLACVKCDINFMSQAALNFHLKIKHNFEVNQDNAITFQSIENTGNEKNLNEDNLEKNESELDNDELLQILGDDHHEELEQEDDNTNKSQNDMDTEYVSSDSCKALKNSIDSESIYCTICKRQFRTKAAFSNHMRRMHKSSKESANTNKSHSCEICGKKGKNLLNHKKLHHSIPICCKICNKELSSEKILQLHMKTHNKIVSKTVPCPKCNKYYPSLLNLKYHLKTHDLNRERKFECELCGKKFFNKAFYNTHLITHTKQEFPCHICGKVLSRKLSLENHIKLHDGGDVKCSQCDKTFTTQSNLQIHMRFHTKEFPFVCEICGQRFPMRGHLTYHMDKHQGVSFKCPVCDKIFTTRACLREHSFVHSGMPIECNLCGKGYPNKYRFKYHLKKTHKLVDPNLEELDRIHIGKFAGSKNVYQEEVEEILDYD